MPIKVKGGGTLTAYIGRLAKAGSITEGDLLYAMGRQGQRIWERTINGLDYREQAFAPYSTKGPYYRSSGGGSRKQKQARAIRHSKKYGGTRIRGGTSVKYASYAAYKAAQGSTSVDLGGMSGSVLSNMEVVVGGAHISVQSAATTSLDSYSSTGATRVAIGVYEGRAARIAEGHNRGVPSHHLPQREFLGVSDSDLTFIYEDIAGRIEERLQALV